MKLFVGVRRSHGYDIVGNEYLAATNAAKTPRLKRLAVVGGEGYLCLEDKSRDLGRNLDNYLVGVGHVVLIELCSRVDDEVNDVVHGSLGVHNSAARLVVKAVYREICGVCKRACRDLHSGVHKLGRALRAVNVVDLEVEILRLIDGKLLDCVGECLCGGHVGVLGVVLDLNLAYAADLDDSALVLDVTLKLTVAVCNCDVLLVKLCVKIFAPYVGNKVCNSHNKFPFFLSVPFFHGIKNF